MNRLFVVVILCAVTGHVAAQAPRLSAASLMCPNGEPFLIYGEGLDQHGLSIRVAEFPPEKDWDAAASLARVLRRRPQWPDQPQGAKVGILTADARTAVVRAYADEGKPAARVIWAQSESGISNPLAVNRPEIWTITPPRPHPGDRLRIFGINFPLGVGFHAGLAATNDQITPCLVGASYSSEQKISPAFERTIVLPADLAPGRYRLFINGGGGDFGWSDAFELEVTPRPSQAKVYPCDDAPVGGETDASSAITAALDRASAAGGGIVTLKAGVFQIAQALRLKPGVILRGAGKGATLLVSPKNSQIPAIHYHYRPIVELKDRTGLEDLSIDASNGQDHCGVLINAASDAILRRCEVVNRTPVFRPEGKWLSGDNVVTAAHDVRRLVVEDCIFRGESPFTHWGGELADMYFGHNVCEGMPTHGANVSFHGLRRCVVEHNTISRGGRGLVVAGEAVHNYLGYNIVRNIRGTTNGCEMFIYEMGGTPWQGAPGQTGSDWFLTPGMKWDEKTLRSTADSYIFTAYAIVTEGRGLGQCIPIRSAVGDRVTLRRPWTIMPDASSRISVSYGCMENIHLENQLKEGVAYGGVFGACARNVWAGDEYERVSDGMVLWGLGKGNPVVFNILRDLRLQDRAGILLIEGIESNRPLAQVEMLGNEIRACQVYNRLRYPGNEYGFGQRVWKWAYNGMPPGNARHVTFGAEAGIHLSSFLDWPGSHTDEDARLEKGIAPMRWTLVWDSLVARSPVGVRIGRGIDATAIVDLTTAQDGRSISDSGRQTRVINSGH